MVAGKIAKKLAVKGLKRASKSKTVRKAGLGAGAAAGAELLEDNPYIAAAEGAAIGFAVAGPIGAIAGGAMGWFLNDEVRITPLDMVAIPSYQYASMLAGIPPTFQIFIKEGEMITPIQPTDTMVGEEILESLTEQVQKKPRKLSKWNRYLKVNKNKIKYKSGKKKGQLNLEAMGRAYRKEQKEKKK